MRKCNLKIKLGLQNNNSTAELTRCQAPFISFTFTKSLTPHRAGSNSVPILQMKQAKITQLD